MAARNVIYWHKIKTIPDALAVSVATALGAGLTPLAPGSMGTLVALPLAYFTRDLPIVARVALWLFLTIIGTWSAKKFDELMNTGDNQCIVIDEVIGLGITSWCLSGVDNLIPWAAAFVLFRFFDITKPFPVRLVDQWSKKKSQEPTPLARWYGGFGVIADDILAGCQGLLLMLVFKKMGVFPN